MVNLYEFDEHDHLVLEIDFDEDGLEATMGELDRRYLAGEGASFAPGAGRAGSVRGADQCVEQRRRLRGPLAGLRARRPLRFVMGTADRDSFLSHVDVPRSLDQPREHRPLPAHERPGGPSRPSTSRWSRNREVGTSGGCASSAPSTTPIASTGWSGSISRTVLDAVVRLHELGTPVPTGPVLENAATLAEHAALASIDAHLRSGGAVALAMPPTAPDFVTDDRRPIVGMPDQNRSGVDAVIATMLAQDTSVPARRSSPFGASASRSTGAPGPRFPATSTHSLVVTELDGEGRFRRQTLFAEDDLEAAMAELDRRYFLGEGAEHADVLRAVGHFAAASANDNFTCLRALLPDDFVTVDHRPLGFGSGDREYFIETSASTEPGVGRWGHGDPDHRDHRPHTPGGVRCPPNHV